MDSGPVFDARDYINVCGNLRHIWWVVRKVVKKILWPAMAALALLLVAGGVWQHFRPPYEADESLVWVRGVPFVLKTIHLMRIGKELPELSVEGMAPDFSSAGLNEARRTPGGERKIILGVFLPSDYTRMEEGRTYPEQVVENLLSLVDRRPPEYYERTQTAREMFARAVSTGREGIAINITHVLNMEPANPPHKPIININKEYFVIFSGSRLILYAACDSRKKIKNKLYPSCSVHFNRARECFSLSFYIDNDLSGELQHISENIERRVMGWHRRAVSLGYSRRDKLSCNMGG